MATVILYLIYNNIYIIIVITWDNMLDLYNMIHVDRIYQINVGMVNVAIRGPGTSHI